MNLISVPISNIEYRIVKGVKEGSDNEVDGVQYRVMQRITENTESRGRGLFNFANWLGAGNFMQQS